MPLKRDDECSVCAAPLAAGTLAQWDSTAKAVTCLSCVEANELVPATAAEATTQPDVARQVEGSVRDASPASLPPETNQSEIDVGTPGASARREFERRKAKNEARIEKTWGTGRIGRIAKALSDDPQSTKAWAQGALGEERVALVLQQRLGEQAVLLHDRKVPRTRGNIDHLVIAASGVWIVDAKRYKGKVERRDVGGWLRSDVRLYVGGRDRTKAVDNLQWQHDAVRTALHDDDVPVHCALSFVDAEWPLFFAKPFQLHGVWISWPKKLADLIGQTPAVLEEADVERLARHLAAQLPAN